MTLERSRFCFTSLLPVWQEHMAAGDLDAGTLFSPLDNAYVASVHHSSPSYMSAAKAFTPMLFSELFSAQCVCSVRPVEPVRWLHGLTHYSAFRAVALHGLIAHCTHTTTIKSLFTIGTWEHFLLYSLVCEVDFSPTKITSLCRTAYFVSFW